MAQPNTSSQPWRRQSAILMATVLFCGLLRLPTIWHSPANYDEAFFAVPGYTIAKEGIPRIPYMPVRDEQSVFIGCDQRMYTLPPGYFYWQSIFFLLLPPSLGTARLASWLAGMICLLAIGVWLRRVSSLYLAITAIVCLSNTRLFLFPWIEARPDMLCCCLGIMSVLIALRARDQPRPSWSALAVGLCVGCGVVVHPYALVFSIQAAMLVLCKKQSWRAFFATVGMLILGGAAPMGLWIASILQDPNLFLAQFGKNLFHDSGQGLFSRLIWPYAYAGFQFQLIIERAGPLQLAWIGGMLILATAVAVKNRRVRPLILLVATGIYLHVALVGPHFAFGYWCYPACLLMVAFTYALSELFPSREQTPKLLIVGAALIALSLPGSGLRGSYQYAIHWFDPNYHRYQFCQRINAGLPDQAKLQVSTDYIFDFYLLRPDVTLALDMPLFYDSTDLPLDYLICGRLGQQYKLQENREVTLMTTFGKSEDLLQCYAEVYQKDAR